MRLMLVAYPLLPVSEASAGGAEQVLWTLERELASRGWETVVAACEGSQVSGRLLNTGRAAQEMDAFAEREREHTGRILRQCAREQFAMILDHSGHFFKHAAKTTVPVLAALHLPRVLYAADAFDNLAENVWLQCVSGAQQRDFSDLSRTVGVLRNGIAVERFSMGGRRSDFLLWLGRVCPEKAPHLAIAAAKRARMKIVVAGQVYPFSDHDAYWEREVKPLIDGDSVQWVLLPSFEEKSRLLREARAVLVSSLVAETTSLVALEAMASGTPVIAFDRGALSEVVPKQAGFVVKDVEEMAFACRRLSTIRSGDCREWVVKNFSAAAMADSYEAVIQDIEQQRRWQERRRMEKVLLPTQPAEGEPGWRPS